MQNRYLKGWKPRIVKQIALLMSIYYLISPFQLQVIMVLHELSYRLEMPTSIHLHNESELSFASDHTQYNHENNIVKHEHTFINLINIILDTSNENQESDVVPFSKMKLKKNITLNILMMPRKIIVEIASEFYPLKIDLNTSYKQELEAPPKTYHL